VVRETQEGREPRVGGWVDLLQAIEKKAASIRGGSSRSHRRDQARKVRKNKVSDEEGGEGGKSAKNRKILRVFSRLKFLRKTAAPQREALNFLYKATGKSRKGGQRNSTGQKKEQGGERK